MSASGASSKRFLFVVALAYLALLAGACWGLFTAQDWAIGRLDNEAERANWEDWQNRADSGESSTDPAEADRPAEPPLLVLLRDHFLVICVTTLLLASFLFAFFVFALRGAMRTRVQGDDDGRQ